MEPVYQEENIRVCIYEISRLTNVGYLEMSGRCFLVLWQQQCMSFGSCTPNTCLGILFVAVTLYTDVAVWLLDIILLNNITEPKWDAVVQKIVC